MKDNLKITVRERGKIVMRRELHNIWLHNGSSFLAHLASYQSFSPDTFFSNLRIRYVGFGIGSTSASVLSLIPPMSLYYPGTNTYNDTTPTQARIERPVRISWAGAIPVLPGGVYPNLTYAPTDQFRKQVDPATAEPNPYNRHFRATFRNSDFNGPGVYPGFYSTVPLSEIAIYAAGTENSYAGPAIAYDSFEPIPKTQNFGFDIDWSVRF